MTSSVSLDVLRRIDGVIALAGRHNDGNCEKRGLRVAVWCANIRYVVGFKHVVDADAFFNMHAVVVVSRS